MSAHLVLVWAAGGLLTLGAALAVYRIVRGPSILDRMIASDVLLTTLMLAVGTEMVAGRRTDLIPVLLVLGGTAAFGTIAVARSISKHDRAEEDDASVDPLGTVEGATEVLQRAISDADRLDDEALDVDDLRPTGPRDPGARS